MLVKREILKKLRSELKAPEVVILLGPRQVGKTTLLRQLEKFAKGKKLKTSFFDLEQPGVLASFNLKESEIYKKLSGAGDVVFIDEFQYLENISRIFKAIYDSGLRVKLFCSGSSSLEIHRHLKESLAGRKFLYRVYPLEFSELKKSREGFSFQEYMRFGGMPGLVKADTDSRKIQALEDIVSSYILKDIKALVKEENIRAFNHMMYLLAEHQGSILSVNSLSREVGLSAPAVNRYLDILEQTYVNFRVFSYSKNLGNELKKSCKNYLYDLGIRNMLLKDFSPVEFRADKGAVLESFVFLKLQTMLAPNMEIKFWRTKDGREVDFILLKDRVPLPIEVKSKIAEPAVPGGIKSFLSKYTVKNALVVNEKIDRDVDYAGCRVRFMTFENFALNFKV